MLLAVGSLGRVVIVVIVKFEVSLSINEWVAR